MASPVSDLVGAPAGCLAHRSGPRKAGTKEHQMTSNADATTRIIGSLRSADGTGVVRMEDRFETDIGDLWSALTDPLRLARWYGEIEGDLRLGGEFRERLFASGWEGTGRVEACDAPHRSLLTTSQEDDEKHVIEATLTADGDQP